MSIMIAALALTIGFIGVFRPSFFYKTQHLEPEQIDRNSRIWKRTGVLLIALGSILIILTAVD